ncbi:Zinc finger protein GLIS2 [Armadillidium nasatum]|uniref:Zinc finger protein GLIS2 n=1 Tax=Armadillidium nasatum TaxID=96803 RepID=A0A5N5T419_9CRUS|nr:Zinc finger protein GLIS2 [Armadillidium nasatum]
MRQLSQLVVTGEVAFPRWVGCGLNFDTLEDLVTHLTASHVTSQHGSFYCLWRGCSRTKGFNARYKMLIHIRTHTNERPYLLEKFKNTLRAFYRAVSPLGFSNHGENVMLNTHFKREKPYVCTVPGCGKAYSNSSDRFKHTRTHFVEKPYECRHPGCGKRYTDPSSLRKHVKIYGHIRRQEEAPPTDPNMEQALAAAAAAARLSPSPSSSSSSLGPSPSPSTSQPMLTSTFFQSAANNVAAAACANAAASLGPSGLNPWAPVTAGTSTGFGAVTAAAAWTVALHQYRAGLILSGGHSSFSDIEEVPTEESEGVEEHSSSSVLDLSVCSSPLDLSLSSSRSRNQS